MSVRIKQDGRRRRRHENRPGFVRPDVYFDCGREGQQAEFDLLIRNGRILDGTGNPSFVNDVGLRDGKIAAIGALANARAARVIDANGLAVAPGFIDIHNHSDDTVLEDGDAQSMVRQGVTSMIFGEGSAAPSAAWRIFPAISPS